MWFSEPLKKQKSNYYKRSMNNLSKHEYAMIRKIITRIKRVPKSKLNNILNLFYNKRFDKELGLHPIELCALALLAYFHELGFAHIEIPYVSIDATLTKLSTFSGTSYSGVDILDNLLKQEKGSHYSIMGKYPENIRKYRHIRDIDLGKDKPRKRSSLPGSKEDIEEISDEQQIEGKEVPAILWGIPIALLIFTIFIGFKIYQKKNNRGK